MGNNCCSIRSTEIGGGISSNGEGSVTPFEESKFRQDLLDRYKFCRVDFSTFGGETESAILIEKNGPIASAKPILIQRYQMQYDNSAKQNNNKRLEQQLGWLKAIKNPAALYTDFYKRDNSIYYVRAPFQGQGTRDLYMLANLRGAFSEHEIGTIAE